MRMRSTSLLLTARTSPGSASWAGIVSSGIIPPCLWNPAYSELPPRSLKTGVADQCLRTVCKRPRRLSGSRDDLLVGDLDDPDDAVERNVPALTRRQEAPDEDDVLEILFAEAATVVA